MSVDQSWRPSYWGRAFSRRGFLATAGAGAAAAFLAACGKSGGGSGGGSVNLSPSDAKKPGALFYAKDTWRLPDDSSKATPGGVYPGFYPADLNGTFDPYVNSNDAVRVFGDQVYEYLLSKSRGPGIQPGSADYAKISPRLAESYEVSPDGLTYTFKMRSNVKFHNVAPVNGRVMDIDDFKTSVERFLSPGTTYRAPLLSVFDKAEYPDAKTMVWRLKTPYSPMAPRLDENMFGVRIMPKELNAKPDLAATVAAGTNYQIADKIQPSLTREFKAHADYWAGKPFIDRWSYPVIPEYSNRYAQFLAKNIQWFDSSTADALKMRGDAPDAVMVGAELSTAPNGFRIGNQVAGTPWNDVRVRIAMRRAIDWQKLTDFFANKDPFTKAGVNVETSFSAHLPSEPDFWLDPRKNELGAASQNYVYDEAEAKKLLEAAGFAKGFEFDFFDNKDVGASPTYTPAYYERNAVIMREYEKALGGGIFKPHMNLIPYREWADQILIKWPMKGFVISWNNNGDVDNVVYRLWHSSNAPAFPDKKLDDLADKQRQIADPQARAAVLKDLQKYLADFFPSIPTQGASGTFSFEWPWLHNSYPYPTVNNPFINGHKQWLDPSTPKRNG